MNKLIVIPLSFILLISLHSQSPSFQIGVSPCLHIPTAFQFSKVYPDNRFAIKGNIGVKSNNIMLLGKYKYFNATGKSIVENAAIQGYAEWKQRITFIGIRGYFEDIFYSEIGVLLTSGSELITTVKGFDQLESYNEFREIGLGLGTGLEIPLTSFLILNAEGELGFIYTSAESGYNKGGTISIGGLTLSVGLIVNLNNPGNEE